MRTDIKMNKLFTHWTFFNTFSWKLCVFSFLHEGNKNKCSDYDWVSWFVCTFDPSQVSFWPIQLSDAWQIHFVPLKLSASCENLNCDVLESGLPLSPPTTRWYNDTCGLLVHTQGQLPPLWHTFADGRSHSYSCILHPHQDKINTPPIPSAE